MPGTTMLWGPRNTVEHYRRFLSFVVYRLQRSREGPGTRGSYEAAQSLNLISCYCETA